MRSRFGFAEHVRTANWAKAAMHYIAAVGHAPIVTQAALDGHRGAGETDIDRAIARCKVLTVAAPTHARHDGLDCASIAHCAAQTPSINFQSVTPPGLSGALTLPTRPQKMHGKRRRDQRDENIERNAHLSPISRRNYLASQDRGYLPKLSRRDERHEGTQK